MKQLKNEVTLTLENLCGILNFDFSPENAPLKLERAQYSAALFALHEHLQAEALNDRTGFPKAAAIVNAVKELLDPIIAAHTAEKPAIELEETLANEVNRRGGITYQLERQIVGGQRSNQWEGCRRQSPWGRSTLEGFLLVQAGVLLLNNVQSKLRRCRHCSKYIFHTAGQMPDFCDVRCRNEFNNANNRLTGRVLQLARFAHIDDYDLTPSNTKKINQWLGKETYQSVRARLQAIKKPVSDVQRFIDELPKAIRTRLATPRQELAKPQASRGRKSRKKTNVRNRRRTQ